MTTSYATLADLRLRIPSIQDGDTRYDSALQAYLNASAQLIDNYTKRGIVGVEVFSATASATRYFNDYIPPDGKLPINDALTITAVTRNGTAQVLDTDYYLLPYERGNGPITHLYLPSLTYTYAFTGYGVKKIAITGTWGYSTADNRPPEIKEATIIQATRMYERANLSTRDLTQMIVNPFRGLDPTVEELIRPYRRMVYVA